MQTELQENGNGLPEYDFSYQTAICVTERKSAKALGALDEESAKTDAQYGAFDEKSATNGASEGAFSEDTFSRLPAVVRDVYDLMKRNRKIKLNEIADNLGLGERTVDRVVEALKVNGLLPQKQAKIKGEWQLLK